jgi:hypothetical protein
MFSLTVFKSIYDNKTDQRFDFDSLENFERLFYDLSKRQLNNKKDALLISPATYKPNTTRANKNVVSWGRWAAIDVDDHKFKGDLKSELVANFGKWYFICYSTASSTSDHPKFRIVFPLTKHVEVDKIRPLWSGINTLFNLLGDKQTKDLSRMYYIPAEYRGANNFIFTNTGDLIDPDDIITKYPYTENRKIGSTFFDRLPNKMQEMIVQHRKDKMENTSIRWTSYRDCPFIARTMLDSYKQTTMVKDSGRYHKMYEMMVHIAGNAVKNRYPITTYEIVQLCKELDLDTGNRYENRPLDLEAERAIEYVYKNTI